MFHSNPSPNVYILQCLSVHPCTSLVCIFIAKVYILQRLSVHLAMPLQELEKQQALEQEKAQARNELDGFMNKANMHEDGGMIEDMNKLNEEGGHELLEVGLAHKDDDDDMGFDEEEI